MNIANFLSELILRNIFFRFPGFLRKLIVFVRNAERILKYRERIVMKILMALSLF